MDKNKELLEEFRGICKDVVAEASQTWDEIVLEGPWAVISEGSTMLQVAMQVKVYGDLLRQIDGIVVGHDEAADVLRQLRHQADLDIRLRTKYLNQGGNVMDYAVKAQHIETMGEVSRELHQLCKELEES